MKKSKKLSPLQEKLAVWAMVVAIFIFGYVGMSWQRFVIEHPKAGEGAFWVYFVEVVTWQKVDDLR